MIKKFQRGRDRAGRLSVEKIAALSLVVLMAAVWWFRSRPIPFQDGQVAPDSPRQMALEDVQPFEHLGHTVTPVASFELEALVLSAKHYPLGQTGRLVPVDLALGWGPMSDGTVVRRIGINQYNRFYHWWTKDSFFSRRDIEINSANMHLIPARKDIERAIKRAKRGHVVSIEGYLVHLSREDGWAWRTSLSREDTGWGACELIWVEEFSILNP